MKIRKAMPKDLSAVQSIDREFFLWACKINPWLDSNYVKKKHATEFRKDFLNKNEIFFIAEEKGKIVGYAEGVIENNSPKFKAKKIGVLESLYIMPGYRGKGLGEKLSRQVLNWFKSKNIKSYKLVVQHANSKAYKLYKKLGFKDYFWIMRI